jgi:hypothetical protein
MMRSLGGCAEKKLASAVTTCSREDRNVPNTRRTLSSI